MIVTQKTSARPSALTDVELHGVIQAAGLAPSVHNTQPWSFTWDGSALCVLEDTSRGLSVVDPTGRERVVSCGAAVLNARLALAALGCAVTVELLPEPARPELLARLSVVAGEPADEADAHLAPAIARRHTDRGVFDDRVVPAAAVRRLIEAVEGEGAWLRPVETVDDRVALAVLLSQADQVERQDPAYMEELAQWRTKERAADGIPDAALARDAPSTRGSDYALRDFQVAGVESSVAVVDPPRPEHPLALVLGTVDDDPDSWIKAGMALGRLLLQVTAEGLAASPMTQVVEVERLRLLLRQELGLSGVPQVVVRVGYGHEGVTTRRRPVDQVLRIV